MFVDGVSPASCMESVQVQSLATSFRTVLHLLSDWSGLHSSVKVVSLVLRL